MTKRETMTEMEIPVDEKTQRKLQKIYDEDNITVGTLLLNFSDALEYSWQPHFDDPLVHSFWVLRAHILELLSDVDDHIDDRIEKITKEDLAQ